MLGSGCDRFTDRFLGGGWMEEMAAQVREEPQLAQARRVTERTSARVHASAAGGPRCSRPGPGAQDRPGRPEHEVDKKDDRMHRAQDGCPGRVEVDVFAVEDADIGAT